MNDSLIPLTPETQSLVNALRSADLPIGGPGSQNTKSVREVAARHLSGHSRTQINQDLRHL